MPYLGHDKLRLKWCPLCRAVWEFENKVVGFTIPIEGWWSDHLCFLHHDKVDQCYDGPVTHEGKSFVSPVFVGDEWTERFEEEHRSGVKELKERYGIDYD